MTSNTAIACLLLISILSDTLLVSSQLTFSKSWVAGGGKRSSSNSMESSSSSSPSSSASSSSIPYSNQASSLYSMNSQLIPEALDQVMAALQPPSSLNDVLNPSSSADDTLYDLILRQKTLQDLLVKTWTVIAKVRIPALGQHSTKYVSNLSVLQKND